MGGSSRFLVTSTRNLMSINRRLAVQGESQTFEKVDCIGFCREKSIKKRDSMSLASENSLPFGVGQHGNSCLVYLEVSQNQSGTLSLVFFFFVLFFGLFRRSIVIAIFGRILFVFVAGDFRFFRFDGILLTLFQLVPCCF